MHAFFLSTCHFLLFSQQIIKPTEDGVRKAEGCVQSSTMGRTRGKGHVTAQRNTKSHHDILSFVKQNSINM